MPAERHHWTTPRTVPWFTRGPDDPRTLVLVLHGLGQRAADVAEQLPDVDGVRFVVPEALSRYLPRPGAPRPGACWSTGDDADIDLADNIAYLDALWAHVLAAHHGTRTVLLGFSQGGLTATRWLAARPRRWDQLILWASVIPTDVDLDAFRDHLGSTDLLAVVGDADPLVTEQARAWMRGRAEEADIRWRVHAFAGGHTLDADTLTEVLS